MSKLQVHILDGGTIDILDWSVFDPTAAPGTQRTLSDPVYLIVHEQGTLLWDTGLGDGLADKDTPVDVTDYARFWVTRSLRGQLVELGYPPESIQFLALSHLHADHTGNLALFGNATLLIQKDEYGAALEPEAESQLDPSSYAALTGRPAQLLSGDHDVFGDGTVVIKRLPGHTVGHQSLLLRLPETGPVLVSGDVTHSLENWEKRAIPQDLNHDVDASLQSLEEAARLLESEGAALWVQHDVDQYRALLAAGGQYR